MSPGCEPSSADCRAWRVGDERLLVARLQRRKRAVDEQGRARRRAARLYHRCRSTTTRSRNKAGDGGIWRRWGDDAGYRRCRRRSHDRGRCGTRAMTSLVNPGLGDGYQDEGSLGVCLREDVRTWREEFWEEGAVKQQRPSAHRLRVKGTEEEEEKPRNNEVIGTLNGPGKDGGEWERWGRVTGGWARGPVRYRIRVYRRLFQVSPSIGK